MRKAAMTLILALGIGGVAQVAGPDASADPAPAEGAAVGRVITAQIDAFRHDDAAGAFALASPGIQRKFGDAAHFIDAVREAYPQVYRPRSFRFGALADEGGQITQRVEIVGPDGRLATAVYDLEWQADGSWRISGCSLLWDALQET